MKSASKLVLAAFLAALLAERADAVDRILVVLGNDDPSASNRVFQAMKPCTQRIPTAVVTTSRGVQVRRDFTTNGEANAGTVPGSSLAAHLSGKDLEAPRTLGASLTLLADALGTSASETAIVVVSRAIGSDPGPFPANPGLVSPANRSTEDEQVSETEAGFADTPDIPRSIYGARKAVRRSGATLIAANIGGRYDPALKALTEIPNGKYLESSEKRFGEKLVSVVCGGR